MIDVLEALHLIKHYLNSPRLNPLKPHFDQKALHNLKPDLIINQSNTSKFKKHTFSTETYNIYYTHFPNLLKPNIVPLNEGSLYLELLQYLINTLKIKSSVLKHTDIADILYSASYSYDQFQICFNYIFADDLRCVIDSKYFLNLIDKDKPSSFLSNVKNILKPVQVLRGKNDKLKLHVASHNILEICNKLKFFDQRLIDYSLRVSLPIPKYQPVTFPEPNFSNVILTEKWFYDSWTQNIPNEDLLEDVSSHPQNDLQKVYTICSSIGAADKIKTLDIMSRIIDSLLESNIEATEDFLVDLLGISYLNEISYILLNKDKIVDQFKKAVCIASAQIYVENFNKLSSEENSYIKRKLNLNKLRSLKFDAVIKEFKSTFNALLKIGFVDKYIEPMRKDVIMSMKEFEEFATKESENLGNYSKVQKRTLPQGVIHTNTNEFEKYVIPEVPTTTLKNFNDLVHKTNLPDWAQPAFKSVHRFNEIQSVVFPAAFESSENILVSAPTGAGKTNIALLCVLQQISAHLIESKFIESSKTFKIVYVAPMKSLVNEITTKLKAALSYLGCIVAELTADMQVTRAELDRIHIIVTVPEKWDILTRSSTSINSLQKTISCIIIDEVHLLNDTRGPIIEAIVARTLRYSFTAQKHIRIVGISATLPNCLDVAKFLQVKSTNVFQFDDSFRSVPLKQTLIGIKGSNKNNTLKHSFDSSCFTYVCDMVRAGHQVMVFVQSRSDTYSTAQNFIRLANQNQCADIFKVPPNQTAIRAKSSPLLKKAFDKNITNLFPYRMSIHHAGMLRRDRNLVEKLFQEKAVQMLFCTATLAWGVNLPAHCVIIKGTKLFDPQAGSHRDLTIIDVLQIFGRAGRPQYDSLGEAILITEHSKLQSYIQSILLQAPLESQLLFHLGDIINAEIGLGTIHSEEDALNWLQYSFWNIRAPYAYGPRYNKSSQLQIKKDILDSVATKLDNLHAIRYNKNAKTYNQTELGKIAARYYISCESVYIYQKLLKSSNLTKGRLLCIFATAQEFEQLEIRPEELSTLLELKELCLYVPETNEINRMEKVSILLQCYLLKINIDSSSLAADAYYIFQNSSRLFRGMLDIAISSGCSVQTIYDIHHWCKHLDIKVYLNHILSHFSNFQIFKKQHHSIENISRHHKPGPLSEAIVKKLSAFDYTRLMETTLSELTYICRSPEPAKLVYDNIRRIPYLNLSVQLQPITGCIFRIHLSINPDFQWSNYFSGLSEPFRIWLENPAGKLLYTESFLLNKRQMHEDITINFMVPLQDSGMSDVQYVIHVVSDRWVYVSYTVPFTAYTLATSDDKQLYTKLLDLHPLPVKVMKNKNYEALYPFTYFNPIQTQMFHTLYHTNHNILLGAPTGSGKTVAAELAILRLFDKFPDQIAVYIAPLKALAKERLQDWQNKFERVLNKRVVELTGDFTPDIELLKTANIVITTPEKWDGVSRNWRSRSYVRKVGLVIIDEIHLLGLSRGPVLEVIVSRMRYISCHMDRPIRFVGLSTALAQAQHISDWLGISQIGLFNFRPSIRPVPCVVHLREFFEKHYCPRMALMNKPAFEAIRTHSLNKPVLIFVSSRRQTRLTALDLANHCSSNSVQFLKLAANDSIESILNEAIDETLKQTLTFGLKESDRLLSEKLFLKGIIQVLITTSTLAWGVNLPAHLVIVKGTEIYDAASSTYVDMPLTDILQMIGRAGRPQYDTSAVACIFVQKQKKDYYKRFLYEPHPVESSLMKDFENHLNAEISSHTIQNRADIIEYLSWTYFFRRLTAHPGYYYAYSSTSNIKDQIMKFLETFVDKSLKTLLDLGCIEEIIEEEETEIEEFDLRGKRSQKPLKLEVVKYNCTKLGNIAAMHYITAKSAHMLHLTIDRHIDNLSWLKLAYLVTQCTEFDFVPVRHNEDLINQGLASKCPIGDISNFNDPHVKTWILLQAHFFGIQLPITDYETDLKSILDQSMRIILAIADIILISGTFSAACNCALLMQCMVQGIHPYKNPLVQIVDEPFLTESYHPTTFSCLIDLPSGKQKTTVKKLFPRLDNKGVAKVLSLCQMIPKLKIQLKLYVRESNSDVWTLLSPFENSVFHEFKYKVDFSKELKLAIGLSETRSDTNLILLKKWSKLKNVGWWCILGDTETNEVIGLKKLVVNEKSWANFYLRICNEDNLSSCNISLLVSSDTFLGLDQQVNLNLQNSL